MSKQAASESAATQQKKAAARSKAKKEERAIIKSSTALQPFGTAEELAILIKRFKYMIPHAKDLTDGQIMSFAHSAIAYGLDPVVRQCCWIPGSGFYPMIAGTRKLGREFFENTYADSRSNREYDKIVNAEELELYDIPPDAVAFKCTGEVTALVLAWTESGKEIREALGSDAPWEAVKEMMGPRPTTIGIGYITAEEMWEKDNPRWWHECKNKENNTEPFKGRPKQYVRRGHDDCPDCGKASWATVNKYPHTQCAQKRSERHWWTQAADLTFQIRPTGEGLVDESAIIEGQFTELDIPEFKTGEELAKYLKLVAESEEHAAELATLSPEERKARADRAVELLYGKEPEPAPDRGPKPELEAAPVVALDANDVKCQFDELVLEMKGTRKVASLTSNAAMLMKQIFDDDDTARHGAQLFLAGKASLSDFNGAELKALLNILNAKPSKQDKTKHVVNAISHQLILKCAAAMQEA